jgi:hypothetical protein
VIIRHILSILGFSLGQIYILLCFASIFGLDADSGGDYTYEVFFQVSCLLFAAQGIFMPLTRMSEKFFFQVVARNVYKLSLLIFCCRKPDGFAKRSEIDFESLLERDLFEDENELLKNASIY